MDTSGSDKQLSQLDLNQPAILKPNPIFTFRSSIKKYPTNGSSPFLISKLFIIGYEKPTLHKLLKKYLKGLSREPNKRDNMQLSEKPTILKSFFSDNPFKSKLIRTDLIIDCIFPDVPPVFYIDKQKPQNITFTINIPPYTKGRKMSIHTSNDPTSGDNRINHTFYSYYYYKKETIDGVKYFCPRAICFQSNYPYFSNYLTLSKYYVEKLILKPVNELWLYHLVNLPAPINSACQLFYFPSSEANYASPSLFPQLSGYPLLHFKIIELFNILPYQIIIKIFIFTLLEMDMIFFSDNLEVLNILMHIFANFNYPLNSSSYFSNIFSVSLKTFKEGTNPYLTKDNPCLIGVNALYDPSYDAFAKKKDFFVVDINQKSIHYKIKSDLIDDNDTLVKRNQLLFEYINKLIGPLNTQSNYFELAVAQLSSGLLKISSCITHLNITEEAYLPDFFTLTEVVQNENPLNNKNIQEKFYSFILKIFSYYYSFNNLELPMNNKGSYSISYYDNKITLADLDVSTIHFGKLFREGAKYITFIGNFIQNFKYFSLDFLPLSFLQEFIHQYQCNEALGKKTFLLFEAIDDYYQIHNNMGLNLTLDNYYNSIIMTVPASYKALLSENNVYNQDIVDYLRLLIETQRRRKKMHKVSRHELFHYVYLNKSQGIADPYKIKCRFELNCRNLVKFSTQLKVVNKNQMNVIENKKNSLAEIQMIRYNMTLNCITDDYASGLQEMIEEKYISQLTLNEVLLCCYVLCFIISKIVDKNDSIEQLELIVDLLMKNRHIYSCRMYITMLINQYIFTIKQRPNSSEENNDEDEDQNDDDDDDDGQRRKRRNNELDDSKDDTHKCLVLLCWILTELNYIPNEELMTCLNNSFENKYITLKEISARGLYSKAKEPNEEEEMKKHISFKTYLQFNIGKNGFYREEYFIHLAKNMLYHGDLYIEEQEFKEEKAKALNKSTDVNVEKQKGVTNNKLCWNVVYAKNKYTTPIYSPLKLFYLLNDIFKRLTVNEDGAKMPNKKELIDICCVLLFYVQNIKDLFKVKKKLEGEVIVERYEHNDYLVFLYNIIERMNSF